MTPDPQATDNFFRFVGALSTLGGLGMAWWRKGSVEEDKEVSQANDAIIDTISDSDMVSRIERSNGRNLRDQLTLEQIEDMNRERELRRMRNRN